MAATGTWRTCASTARWTASRSTEPTVDPARGGAALSPPAAALSLSLTHRSLERAASALCLARGVGRAHPLCPGVGVRLTLRCRLLCALRLKISLE